MNNTSGDLEVNAFSLELRALRESAGISIEDLAGRTGVSIHTLRAYEQGRRMPSAARVARIAEGAGATEGVRRSLYEAAGHPAPTSRYALFQRGRHDDSSVASQLASQRWVSLVTNERHEIVGWNGLANAVAETDLGEAVPTDIERNLLWMACQPHFERRLLNWEELMGRFLAVLRAEGVDAGAPSDLPPHLAVLLNRLIAGGNPVLVRLYNLWNSDLAPFGGGRNAQRVVWRLENGGEKLTFRAVVREWSLYDGVFAFDWMADNEETSAWVTDELARSGESAWAPASSPLAPAAFGELLEASRHALGLSRRDAAERAGMGESTIYAYERGTRRPARDALVRLTRALVLSGQTTNQMLTALGYEPEPSDHARWLAGERPSGVLTGIGPAAGLTRAEVYAELDSLPWPCFLLSDQCEVERANRAAEQLTGLSTIQPAPGRLGPHLLQFILAPAIRRRVRNWRDLAGAVLPDTLRLQIPHLPDPKQPGTFHRELRILQRSEPAALRDLLDAWHSVALRPAPIRVATPLEWEGERGETLLFHCFITRWNSRDRWWAIDWHPANPAAWDAYRRAAAG